MIAIRHTAELLAQYAVNKVLATKDLKAKSLRLYKVLQNNFNHLEQVLAEHHGISVWDNADGGSRDMASVECFIRYHYGNTVNLTHLRKNHWSVYHALCTTGSVTALVKDMGFEIVYNHLMTDENIDKELRRLASENDVPIFLKGRLYRAVYHRARLEGISANEYVARWGLRLKSLDVERILYLRDVEKLSLSKIAKMLGASHFGVSYVCKVRREKFYAQSRESESQ